MTTTKTKPYKTRRLLLECYHFLTWRVFFPLIYDSLLKDVCLPVLNLIPHQLGSLGPLVLLQFRSNVTFELHVSAGSLGQHAFKAATSAPQLSPEGCLPHRFSLLPTWPGLSNPLGFCTASGLPPTASGLSLSRAPVCFCFFFLKRLGLLSSCTDLLPPLTQALSGCKLGF